MLTSGAIRSCKAIISFGLNAIIILLLLSYLILNINPIIYCIKGIYKENN